MDAAWDTLDPQVLATVANLELRARFAVEGFLNGLHKSPYRGFSSEFTDYRHYYPGDDLRHLDWKLFARSDRYYIKQYEDETNVRCYVVLDSSASMDYGSGGLRKIDYSVTLAAVLAYFMMRQKDAVGLMTFNETTVDFLDARFRRNQLVEILARLNAVDCEARTNVAKPLYDLGSRLSRRSLVVVISDLLDEQERTVKAVQQLKAGHHDVIVFQVLDNAELTFPFRRTAEFVDMEDASRRMISPRAIRKGYLEAFGAFCESLKSRFQLAGVDFVPLDTSRPIGTALSAYLSKRARKL